MMKILTSALLRFAPCVLFIFGDEILSLIALSIMGISVIGRIIAAREAL